jgi:hypothetical protein
LAISSLVVIYVGVQVANTIQSAAAAADHSAHAALTEEIFALLAAISNGQPYPESLSELPLTFPDGGGRSLLSRFDYRRTATGCTARTTLRGEEFVRTFP